MVLIAIKASWFAVGTGIIFLTLKKEFSDYWSCISLILLHRLIG